MKKLLLAVVLLGSVGAAYAFENHWSEDWSLSETSLHSGNGHSHSCHDNWFF